MVVERCPVCNGNGIVPNGFYAQTIGQWSTTDASAETCRSCAGKGYVVVEDEKIEITSTACDVSGMHETLEAIK